MTDPENSGEQRPKPPVGRPFQPGQSGNPGGRPSASKRIRELAQAEGENCVTTLVRIRDDEKANRGDRIAAARELLDRGFGKASQPIDGDGEGGPVSVIYRWAGEGE